MGKIENILQKGSSLQEITPEEGMLLYNQCSISALMECAVSIRRKLHPLREVTWQIDRNVNYTNVCKSGCLFCNFHVKPHDKSRHYTCQKGEYLQKIVELREICDQEAQLSGVKHPGYQLLLQGGLHPEYGIEYYETLFKTLKEIEPSLKLNALGPPEVAHISKISGITYRETLLRLMNAGLTTFPGAGAEILSERVRRVVSPAKPSVKEWCDVMHEAHKLRLSTTATMVYGGIETPQERVQHLFTIRELQNRKPKDAIGFRSFIAWPMQLSGTPLKKRIESGEITPPQTNSGPSEFLRIIALSRIILSNVPHIQASWLTIGRDVAQIALHGGADDLGSIMIEENVVSSAGSKHRLSIEGMKETIRGAGFTPVLRDQLFNKYYPKKG